ncbi:MAG: hypothetical protein FWC68_05460, partial [Oscillospiraceae bacterium]|nr:hypothetical protein [Oscillospiraceae bacterium]
MRPKEEVFSKKMIHMYIIGISIIVIFTVVGFIMLRYSVEGERNLPFEIKEISIISTADVNQQRDEEDEWITEVFQKNAIYFRIEANQRRGRDEIIQSVVFDSFSIEKYNETGSVKIYRQYNRGEYRYTDEFLVEDRLEFVGNVSTNISELQINNRGGIIGFSVVIKGLGEYEFDDNELFTADGLLLDRIDVTLEDIMLVLSFNITIETVAG